MINQDWHTGCMPRECYVKLQGATQSRTKNLRGLLDYGRKFGFKLIETRKDPRVPNGGNLRITYCDGAIGHAHFRSHGILIDWVRNRRVMRGVDTIHHDGDMGYLTKPGTIAGGMTA